MYSKALKKTALPMLSLRNDRPQPAKMPLMPISRSFAELKAHTLFGLLEPIRAAVGGDRISAARHPGRGAAEVVSRLHGVERRGDHALDAAREEPGREGFHRRRRRVHSLSGSPALLVELAKNLQVAGVEHDPDPNVGHERGQDLIRDDAPAIVAHGRCENSRRRPVQPGLEPMPCPGVPRTRRPAARPRGQS